MALEMGMQNLLWQVFIWDIASELIDMYDVDFNVYTTKFWFMVQS